MRTYFMLKKEFGMETYITKVKTPDYMENNK